MSKFGLHTTWILATRERTWSSVYKPEARYTPANRRAQMEGGCASDCHRCSRKRHRSQANFGSAGGGSGRKRGRDRIRGTIVWSRSKSPPGGASLLLIWARDEWPASHPSARDTSTTPRTCQTPAQPSQSRDAPATNRAPALSEGHPHPARLM